MPRAGWLQVSGLIAAACAWLLLGGAAGTDAASESAATPTYDSGGRRDPFVPLVRDGRLVGAPKGVHIETTQPVLYGVLWDPAGQSIALINDGEAKVGDTIGGYRVTEIRRDAVVLENGGEPLVLEISFETAPGLPPNTTTGGEGP